MRGKTSHVLISPTTVFQVHSTTRLCCWMFPQYPPPPAPPVAANLRSSLNVLLSCKRHGRVAFFQHLSQHLRRRARVLQIVADLVPQADAPAWFTFAGGFERSSARGLADFGVCGIVGVAGVQERCPVAVLVGIELAVVGGGARMR